ncbi:amidase family protein [Candidatus Entotheonella palauensis]|uniref:amidase family protein n=1 Tax=Candidatus Entotheonella palauensis TaxID=93172 RepID=UPI000B7FA7B5|nr:amidase family protein [Candidatus Entotheonella palauensis]
MTIDYYSTATAMLEALHHRQISSLELVDMHIARIEELDGTLNAIPVRSFDRARQAAKQADERMAAGDTAPLLGLPMTLKESTLAADLPQSAGIPNFKDYRPAVDGPVAASVFQAGACLLGKTNIPYALADWQADSTIYGRTNNPWDLSRTPGGSTGGGGAALAAGMTPLEVGSDIGGSIRVPAAYCGVYGHRPSETAIPKSGGFPKADLPNPTLLMSVQGPLARSAVDLELLFNVLIGPEPGEDVGWKLDLPAARHQRLADFRVALLPPPMEVRASNRMQARLEALASWLSRQGTHVAEAAPAFDMEDYYKDYLRLLAAMATIDLPREEREAQAAKLRKTGDPFDLAEADGYDMDAVAYCMLVSRRERARIAWRDFFRDWDVVLAPMALDVAFPHQEAPEEERFLTVDDRVLPYETMLLYAMPAIFAGQPSTAFAGGLSEEGLPLGLQAVGPYLEDRTTLKFVQLIEEAWYQFEPPPGY